MEFLGSHDEERELKENLRENGNRKKVYTYYHKEIVEIYRELNDERGLGKSNINRTYEESREKLAEAYLTS